MRYRCRRLPDHRDGSRPPSPSDALPSWNQRPGPHRHPRMAGSGDRRPAGKTSFPWPSAWPSSTTTARAGASAPTTFGDHVPGRSGAQHGRRGQGRRRSDALPRLVRGRPRRPAQSTAGGNAYAEMNRAFAGMPVTAYRDSARAFLDRKRHSRYGTPYTDLYYQPMVELMRLLEERTTSRCGS